MTSNVLAALLMFALVSSITPGPNNMMLLASGANFGFRRTLPHMFGVCLGFTLMVVLVGIGITRLFELFPLSYTVLKYVSIAYLLYLAFKIATANPTPLNETSNAKPITFLQAVLFQWVNPKAWTMALTAISVYAPNQDIQSVLIVALAFGLVNLPSITTWAVLGRQLKLFLTSGSRLRIFNVSMGLLLVGSLYPVIV